MASSDARPIPRKNTAYRVTFPIFDADGDLVTGATGLDSEYSGDGGEFADCTNEATEIITSSGMYYLDLTAGEMNYDTVAIIVKTSSSGAKTTPIVIYPEEAGDVRVAVSSIDAGAITAAAIATGAIDADALATDAVAEIADGVLDEALAGHTTAGTVGDALNDLLDVTTVTVVSAVSGTTLTILRGDTLSATFTGLASNTGYVTIDLTVKEDKTDADSAAILKIRLNAPSANDGLLYLNGAAPVAPVVSTDGTITVNSATSITVALAARATDDLTPQDGLYYDIQYVKATGVTTVTEGICNITADVTRSIA
jgi:hypothetical protein